MMSKLKRPLAFLYSFVFTLMILLTTVYVMFKALGSRQWFHDLIHTVRLNHLPLIVYIILIALTVAAFLTATSYMSQRHDLSKIEKKLTLLAKGRYDDSSFMTLQQNPVEGILGSIEADIAQIHQGMLEMSKELQVYSSRPVMVSGETKEEIIEQERRRLARELHDSVSQQLFAASMLLSAVQEDEFATDFSPAFKKQLNTIETIINASQSEMRALLLHLRPISLEGKRLKAGLEQLLKELGTKVTIDISWDIADVSLKNGVEDHLFRIVQELLSNTLRHSKAKTLEVYLQYVDQNILLKVVDDGVGFDTNQSTVGSYGLSNIKERVNGMGGTCKLISFKGQGTSVEIRIPNLKEEMADD